MGVPTTVALALAGKCQCLCLVNEARLCLLIAEDTDAYVFFGGSWHVTELREVFFVDRLHVHLLQFQGH